MKFFDRPLVRATASVLLRVSLVLLGAWLVALLPVEIRVAQRRAAIAAAGLLPNIDPGVIVTTAALMLVVPLAALLLIELVRCGGLGFRLLPWDACLALGALATWPIGLACTGAWRNPDYRVLLFSAALSVLPLYAMTWTLPRKVAGAAG